jgi:hypothetical protein
VYDTPEETAMQSDDPFLASLEAHVVAKAQRRLRAKDKQEASQAHISEARKAIKAALLDAQSSSLHQIKKAEQRKIIKKKIVKKAKKGTKAAKTAKTVAPAKAGKAGAKQFTWDQLQRGEDAKEEIFTENKVSGLLSNLKAAPHTDKSMGANTVVVGDGSDDEEIEQGTAQSEDKLSSALHHAKASATQTSSDDEDDEPTELAQVQAASGLVDTVSVAGPSAHSDDEDAFEDDEEFED